MSVNLVASHPTLDVLRLAKDMTTLAQHKDDPMPIARRFVGPSRRLAIACAFAILPAAAVAAPAVTLAVTGVSPGDVLTLRAAPEAKSAKVGSLPRNTTGISVDAVASKGIDWVHVTSGKQSGWANAKFLAHAHLDDRLPVRLACHGTEPFWSLGLGYGLGAFEASDGIHPASVRTLALEAPMHASNRGGLWSMTTVKDHDFLVVEKTACNDGMSDQTLPYRITLRYQRVLLDGCCR